MTAEPMLFKKAPLQTDFSRLNKLIYGFPKTGKSTFASLQKTKDGKEPLFIATEDGHGALDVYAQRIKDWDEFKRFVTHCEKHKLTIQKQHSCFVVDLVSDLDMMAAIYVAKTNNVQHLADLDFGKGFALHKAEFQGALQCLFNILPVTFIAHSSDKEIMWNNEKIKIQSPSMAKGCLEYVNGKVDLIMWISPSNSKKEYPDITMKQTTTCIVGTRFKQLAKDFRYFPENPQTTYDLIQKTFEEGVKSGQPAAQQPAKAPG